MKRKFNNTMSYYRLQIFVLIILQYLKIKALVKCNTAVGIKGKQAKGKKVREKKTTKTQFIAKTRTQGHLLARKTTSCTTMQCKQ